MPSCERNEENSSVEDRGVQEQLKNDFVVPSGGLPQRLVKAWELIRDINPWFTAVAFDNRGALPGRDATESTENNSPFVSSNWEFRVRVRVQAVFTLAADVGEFENVLLFLSDAPALPRSSTAVRFLHRSARANSVYFSRVCEFREQMHRSRKDRFIYLVNIHNS